MTQFVRNENGDVIAVADNDPRATGDAIGASLAQQGIYQSPDGWAIVTGSPGGQLGGAPRIILDTNGKQPPADVLNRFPMASQQEQQGFQQQAAQYKAGEGKPIPFSQAVLTAIASYFGGSALGGMTGGAGASGANVAGGIGDWGGIPGATGTGGLGSSAGGLGNLSATDLGGGYSSIGQVGAPSTGAGGGMSGIFDQFGNLDSSLTDPVYGGGGGGTNSFYDPTNMDYSQFGSPQYDYSGDPSLTDPSNYSKQVGPNGDPTVSGNGWGVNPSQFSGNILSQLKSLLGGNAGSVAGAARGLFNADGSLNLGSLLNGAASAIPGAVALNYANNQPGIDVGPLQGIMGQFGGLNTNAQQGVLGGLQSLQQQESASAPGYVQSITDPVQRNIASGYGALQQSQALRGIGGSSFGDTSLANYMDQGNRTLANAGATANQTAQTLQNQNLGMQGTLASGMYNSQLASLLGQGGLANNVITQQNLAQKNKNDLFGRAFSAFGNLGGSSSGLGSGLDLAGLLKGYG